MSQPATTDFDALERRLRDAFAIVVEPISCAGRLFEVLHPRSADELISEEEFNLDERIPYWAEIWPSARVLAQRLTGLGVQRQGRLLELGCGCGYVALVAAQLGLNVLATDYYQSACDFVMLNAARHGLGNVQSRMMNWRHLPDDLGKFDCVIAADVLYERDYCRLIAEVIANTLAPTGRAIVTDPGRKRAEAFLECCAEMGLTGERTDRISYQDGVNHPFVDIYELHWS